MLVSLWLNSSASSVIICVHVDVTDTVAKGKEGGDGDSSSIPHIFIYINLCYVHIAYIVECGNGVGWQKTNVGPLWYKYEGPKRRPEGGWMRADKKLSKSEARLMIPKYTPNPNVLGEVRCSYGKATPTQNNLRNKRDKSQKQTHRISVRECTV